MGGRQGTDFLMTLSAVLKYSLEGTVVDDKTGNQGIEDDFQMPFNGGHFYPGFEEMSVSQGSPYYPT